MRVLGIDPGTLNMGWGLVEGDNEPKALTWGVIKAKRTAPIHERLAFIFDDLQLIFTDSSPCDVAIETPFIGSNDRHFVQSAMAIGQAQATAFIAAVRAGMMVFSYSPTSVKQSVADYGAASKSQVQDMVRMCLNLDDTPMPNDASDALAVAICHWRHQKLQQLLSKGH